MILPENVGILSSLQLTGKPVMVQKRENSQAHNGEGDGKGKGKVVEGGMEDIKGVKGV